MSIISWLLFTFTKLTATRRLLSLEAFDEATKGKKGWGTKFLASGTVFPIGDLMVLAPCVVADILKDIVLLIVLAFIVL